MSKELINLVNNPNVKITMVSEKEHPSDGFARRLKDIALFFTALSLIMSAFIFCAYVMFSHQFGQDNEKWAMAVDSSIISGLLSYLIGKKAK